MKVTRKLFVAAFVIMFFLMLDKSFAATKYQIGVSPSVVDLGLVERGTSKIVTFYIVTQSTEDLLVSFSVANGNPDFFGRSKYRELLQNYSEQNVSAWLDVLENPVTLKEREPNPLLGGRTSWRQVNMVLNVPEDAEPGYHVIKVTPFPYVPAGGSGARIVAIVSVNILFQVPGNAVRSGKVLDITTGRFWGNRIEIETHFENTGTVTVSAQAKRIDIYNEEVLKTLKSSIDYVKPGETKKLTSYLISGELKPGEYNAEAVVSYRTGSDKKKSVIEITAAPPPVEAKIIEKPPEIPLTPVIIIVIIAVAYLIYRRS